MQGTLRLVKKSASVKLDPLVSSTVMMFKARERVSE